MSKAVNIIEVLEKAQQSPASVSKKNKQAVIDAYGRALTMQKVLADFIKVNRQLMIEIAYHQCKVPTQYKQIQAMPLSESTVSRNKKATIDEVADFRISA